MAAAAAAAPAKKVYLVSSQPENDKYEVDVAVAKMSEVVKVMLPKGKIGWCGGIHPLSRGPSSSQPPIPTHPFALSKHTDDDDIAHGMELPLLNVPSAVLAKVVEFCKHFVEEGEGGFDPARHIPKVGK